MIVSLSNCIVRLNGFGAFQMRYLFTDEVTEQSRVLLQDNAKKWFVVNIDTGLLTRSSGPFEKVVNPRIEYAEWYSQQGVEMTYKQGKKIVSKPDSNYKYEVVVRAAKASDDLIRVVAALISHQVEGDRILKSLKALGYDYSRWKVTEVYVGG